MNSALSPREIQSRLRAGASVPEVAAEAGVEVERISGFALPVLAERAHMTRTALASAVRRRGEGSGHRRLGDIIHERLQARGLDADSVEWDAWRQNDLRWRLVGLLDDQAASRSAEFIFDPKGRFSVADNADARWMIGEELPGRPSDPDNENTIDFQDELALVRAVSDDVVFTPDAGDEPGDDVPPLDPGYEQSARTSALDELYDMLSGVSEDSVRIYLGLEDAATDSPGVADDAVPTGEVVVDAEDPADDELEARMADELSEHPELGAGDPTPTPANEAEPGASAQTRTEVAAGATTDLEVTRGDTFEGADGRRPKEEDAPEAPEQDALVPEPDAPAAATAKRKPAARKRASIPSWDEIMFGGPAPR